MGPKLNTNDLAKGVLQLYQDDGQLGSSDITELKEKCSIDNQQAKQIVEALKDGVIDNKDDLSLLKSSDKEGLLKLSGKPAYEFKSVIARRLNSVIATLNNDQEREIEKIDLATIPLNHPLIVGDVKRNGRIIEENIDDHFSDLLSALNSQNPKAVKVAQYLLSKANETAVTDHIQELVNALGSTNSSTADAARVILSKADQAILLPQLLKVKTSYYPEIVLLTIAHAYLTEAAKDKENSRYGVHYADASRKYQLAIDSLQTVGDREADRLKGVAYIGLGDIHLKDGDYAQAKSKYDKALKILNSDSFDLEIANAHSGLAKTALYQNRKTLALTHYTKAVESYTEALKTITDPDQIDKLKGILDDSKMQMATLMMDVANTSKKFGRLDEAMSVYRSILDIVQEGNSYTSLNLTVAAHLGLGDIEVTKRYYGSANRHYDAALKIANRQNFQFEAANAYYGLARTADEQSISRHSELERKVNTLRGYRAEMIKIQQDNGDLSAFFTVEKWFHYRAEELEGLIKNLRPEVEELQAQPMIALKDYKKAIELFETVLSNEDDPMKKDIIRAGLATSYLRTGLILAADPTKTTDALNSLYSVNRYTNDKATLRIVQAKQDELEGRLRQNALAAQPPTPVAVTPPPAPVAVTPRPAAVTPPPAPPAPKAVTVENVEKTLDQAKGFKKENKFSEATAKYNEALRLADQVSDKTQTAGLKGVALIGLGDVELKQGHYDTAAQQYSLGIAALKDKGFPQKIADAYYGLALIANAQQNIDDGLKYFTEAVNSYREALKSATDKKPLIESYIQKSYLQIAELNLKNVAKARAAKNFEKAKVLYQANADLASKITDPNEAGRVKGMALTGLAEIEIKQGHNEAAVQQYGLAIDALKDKGLDSEIGDAYFGLAIVSADTSSAVKNYRLAIASYLNVYKSAEGDKKAKIGKFIALSYLQIGDKLKDSDKAAAAKAYAEVSKYTKDKKLLDRASIATR